MAPVAEDELLLQRAVELKLLTKEQLGRCIAAQKKLFASGKNVSLPGIVRAAKYLTQAQFDGLRKSLDKEEAIPRLGGFEILGRIGKGGMGYVFKARQVSMDRLVALKILPPRLAKDKSFVERFHREAKAAARLNHTNIIQSIDVGEQEGHHYFAMEFVEGPTVDEILTKTGRMEENLVIDVVLQVARAIQAAEKLKIVHLDIKPSNIMITQDRIAKLADFGLARRMTEGATQGKQQIVFGTPEYISPEQALGHADLDSRSDIYSLGATLYHMLTGEPPFKGATPREIVDRRLSQAPVHPKHLNPNLSDQICQVLDKMLQRDRNYRYQTASEMIEDLEYIQRSRSAQAVWPMAIMQQQVQGVQQGDVLYDEVSSMIGPSALRAARRPSKAGLAIGVIALLVLGVMSIGAIMIFINEDLRNKVMRFLGEEPGRKKTVQAPRPIGDSGAGVTAPVPVAQLPEALPTPVQTVQSGKADSEKCIAAADAKIAAGDYKGAFAALDAFPRQWRETVHGAGVREKRKALELELQARFNQDIEQAKQYRRDEKLVEARRTMEKISAYLLPSMEAEYADAMRTLEAVEKRAQKEWEAKNLDKLRDEAKRAGEDSFGAQNFDAAVEKIKAMVGDVRYSVVKAELELRLKDVLRAREFAGAVVEGGKSLIGQPFSVRGIAGGKLKSFDGRALVVEVNGKDLPSLKLEELKPKELLALATGVGAFKSKEKGEQHLMCALYLMAWKRADHAAEQLEAAKKCGVDVSRFSSASPAAPPASPKSKPAKGQ